MLAASSASPSSAGFVGSRLPGGFLPEEDQGYLYLNVAAPAGAPRSQRTDAVCDKVEAILAETPGVQATTRASPASACSATCTPPTTPSSSSRSSPGASATRRGSTADVIMRDLNRGSRGLPEAVAFAFSPPAIPGVGTSGGVTFMLEDRAGGTSSSWPRTPRSFLEAARKRPEIATVTTHVRCRACRRSSPTWTATRC